MDTTDVLCACGRPATANGRECPRCFRVRLGTVHSAYTPSRTEGHDPKAQRRLDRRLESYRRARAEGLQPRTTRQKDVDDARRIADATGSFTARAANA
jgi:hypothetical protein